MNDLIEDYLDHLRRIPRSPETIRLRATILYRLDADLPTGIDTAATHEIQAWLGRHELKPWSRYTYYEGVIDAYGYWCSGTDPWLTWDPTLDLVPPEHPDCLPDPVTDEELAVALERSGHWWQVVITLAALEGLRCSEICRLRRENVTEETIRVNGKGGHDDVVDTHPDVWALLAHYPPGHVVVGERTRRPITGNYLSHRARIHFNRIGLPDVHLHRLRHWTGTTVQRATGNIRITQRVLRHRSVVSTEGYTQVLDAERRRAVNQLRLPGRKGARARS